MPTQSFHTTCWTRVLEARGDSTQARVAMRDLCDRYYQPVIGYLQKAERLPKDEAMDLAHSFFEELLSGDRLKHIRREKGLFRSYLLGALKHFLSKRRRHHLAQKRGGESEPVALHEAMADSLPHALPPDQWFDRQWAITLLARALDRVEADCASSGQAELFASLSPWLTGDADFGDQAQLAQKLELSVSALKSSVYRLRKRFRDAVKAEIADTLIDGRSVETEMQALFEALRGGDE